MYRLVCTLGWRNHWPAFFEDQDGNVVTVNSVDYRKMLNHFYFNVTNNSNMNDMVSISNQGFVILTPLNFFLWKHLKVWTWNVLEIQSLNRGSGIAGDLLPTYFLVSTFRCQNFINKINPPTSFKLCACKKIINIKTWFKKMWIYRKKKQ